MSPSLNLDSPIDTYIKSNLIVDTLNQVGLQRVIPNTMKKFIEENHKCQENSGIS